MDWREKWTWEEVLDGAGPWHQAEDYRRPQWEIEAAKAERRRYEAMDALREKHERHPQEFFWGGHTGSLARRKKSRKPATRGYMEERMGWRALCCAEERTISPIRTHSPVRVIPAPRRCRARAGIQPGRRMLRSASGRRYASEDQATQLPLYARLPSGPCTAQSALYEHPARTGLLVPSSQGGLCRR